MIRGLLAKELHQHAVTLAFLALLIFGGLTLITGHDMIRRAGGGLDALRLLHYTCVPLACLVLGQALIATEFRQKTQLFLEGLPLPRWRMLVVKFCLGLAVMLATMGVALAIAWWRAREAEAMTPRFATLLALKSAGWVWFFYTLCFAHAFLGRYRMTFGVILGFALICLLTLGVRVSEFGPFALVDQRFAYERHVFPATALAVTGLAGAGLAALGFALGLVRDATVATLLAEKMSSREKVTMTLLVVVGLMVGTYLYEYRRTTTPVQMPGAIEVVREPAKVLASAAVDAPSRAELAALDAVAIHAAQELQAVGRYLGCPSLPIVFIVHRRDFAGGVFEKGDLKAAQGVMVRANLTDPGFRNDQLDAWLLREVLLAHTSGFAGRERNAWLFDGLQWWWPQSRGGTVALDPAAREAARAAMPSDFAPRHLHAWLSLRQQLGEDRARALAGSGLAALAELKGPESCQRLLAASFAAPLAANARGWLRDALHPASHRLRDAAGMNEARFIAAWRTALAQP
ncbi:MAG: hypothetical protein JWQ44_1396 [Chthoniobacter sp.]|nr:hypothetical protein [Chthoniobacter sp.]